MKKHLLLLGCALIAAPALRAQNPVGEVFASDASVRGSVVLSGKGTQVLSGSQVSAGEGVALLKLERGGEVRICPKTNLSLSVDASGKSLVLGMNAGAMELNYSLQTAVDSLITPDFRFQLISPGNFHLAISMAPSGDTCLRSLAGNDASVFVAEMMGTDSYQLSPGKSVLFKAGRISGATEAPVMCGCPNLTVEAAPQKPMATTTPTATPAPESTSAPVIGGVPSSNEAEPEAKSQAESNVEANLRPHMEVQSSFVYRGSEAVQDYSALVAKLSVSTDNSELTLALLPKVSGPVERVQAPPRKEGLMRRFGHFLGRLFK